MSTALIETLVEQVTPAAAGGGLALVIGLLARRVVWQAICEVFNRLTDHDVKLIKANADAEATRVKAAAEAHATILTAQANADKTRAEADNLRADAVKKHAEVEQLQTQVGRVDELCKKLKVRGIDWQAEVGEDGKMRVVVAKQPPTEA